MSIIPLNNPTNEPISILEYTSVNESSRPAGSRNVSLLRVNGLAIANITKVITNTYFFVNSFVSIGNIKGIIK